jgi:hypothetical protein
MNNQPTPKQQLADIILETVKTQKPETTQQLVALFNKKLLSPKK